MPTQTIAEPLPDALAKRLKAENLNQTTGAERIGIKQGTLCKVLDGQPFGRKVGAAIVQTFPDLREAVASALLGA